MIKANELRVGSWVLYANKYYEKIELSTFYGMEGAGHNMQGASKTNTNFTGILLTEDILKLCNLDKEEFSWYEVSDICIKKDGTTIGNYVFINTGEYILTTIQYLHQLQNLYFSLIGEELEINENEFDQLNKNL